MTHTHQRGADPTRLSLREVDRALGYIFRQIPDPLQSGRNLDRRDEHPQILSHRLSQSNRVGGQFVELQLQSIQLVVPLNRLARKIRIAIFQRVQSVGEDLFRHPAHLGDLRLDCDQIIIKGRYNMGHCFILTSKISRNGR